MEVTKSVKQESRHFSDERFNNKNLKLSERIYNCPNCNTSIDRDINAAINIRNYGQELHNKSINQAS